MMREMEYRGGMIYPVGVGSYAVQTMPPTPPPVAKPKEKDEKLQKIISYYYTRKK
jgi:hypothetical protein